MLILTKAPLPSLWLRKLLPNFPLIFLSQRNNNAEVLHSTYSYWLRRTAAHAMYLFLPTTQQHKAMSNERQLQERRCLIFLCKATETPSIFYICTPREYTHCYICYSDSSCGQKKPGLPLNLCYLSYRLLYGCMDWCTIHSKLNRCKTLSKSDISTVGSNPPWL